MYFCQNPDWRGMIKFESDTISQSCVPNWRGLVQYLPWRWLQMSTSEASVVLALTSGHVATPPGRCAIKHWLNSSTNRNKRATRISQVAMPNCDIPRGSSLPPCAVLSKARQHGPGVRQRWHLADELMTWQLELRGNLAILSVISASRKTLRIEN
jgi:hypothetical protein